MEYQHFTSTDFALDEYFQRWVIIPDEGTHLFWDTWILQHPEKQEEVEKARQMIHTFRFRSDELSDTKRQQLYENILHTIQQEKPLMQIGTIAQKTFWQQPWMRIAASLVGVLAFAGILFWYINRPVTYHTKYGETQTITLPDHSKVVLNAHSTLKYNRNWNSSEIREVWLQGEAFFEVSKKELPKGPAKFQVHTEDLTVEVIGTKFNVSKRNELTAVTLNEGKVKLELNTRQPARNIFMKPGEMVRFSEENQKIERTTVKAEAQSSWTKNYWILDNTSLIEIAQRIEATYGYPVSIVDEKLRQESMSGVLPTKTIAGLLEVLAVTYNVTIQRTDSQIIITK